MSEPGDHVSARWAGWRKAMDLDDYHTQWERLEASGTPPHGEADLVASYGPASVLDAGCGMGRLAIELDRRGIEVEGADLDGDLLAFARTDAPHLTWHHADLATLDLGRPFDLVVMAGNVMIFCRPDDRLPIVIRAARHLGDGGLLVSGFKLERGDDALTLDGYDAACAAAGLVPVDRFATWERDPFDGGDYAVSVHRRA